jgi:uncharacterized delta-60 repeat protein
MNITKHRVLSAALASLGLLAACNQAPQLAEPIAPEAAAGFVGTLTLTVSGEDDPQAQFVPAAFFDQTSASPPLTFLPAGVQRVVNGSDRYFNFNFSVRNNTSQSLKNLTMVAAHKTGNINNSAFSAITGAATIDLVTLVTQVMPTQGVKADATVDTGRAGLQLFNQSDLDVFTAQAGTHLGAGEYLLGYGYLVRNTGNGPTIPGVGPARLTNKATISFKAPSADTTNTSQFTMTYLVFTDDTEALSEGVEEQTVPSLAGRDPTSANIAALPAARVTRTSNYAGGNRETVCQVKVVGGPTPVYLDPALAPFEVLPGLPDVCFGVNGWARTQVGDVISSALDGAIQPDGKIVAAGFALGIAADPPMSLDDFSVDFALTRHMPSGRLDPSFGVGGKRRQDLGSLAGVATAVDIMPAGAQAGKIVVAGALVDDLDINAVQASVVRFTSAGQLDPSFGVGGKANIPVPINQGAVITDIVAVGDKVVVGGTYIDLSTSTTDFFVARMTSTGALDPSFGMGGMMRTNIGDPLGNLDVGIEMDVDATGRIALAGVSLDSTDIDFAIARYTAGGMPDVSFNGTGKLKINVGTPSIPEVATGLAWTPDGKLVVGGVSGRIDPMTMSPSIDFALIRLNANGSLDTGFGTMGKTFTDFGGGLLGEVDLALDLKRQSDGKIVMGGGEGLFKLARYSANGVLDASYGLNGLASSMFGDLSQMIGLSMQTDDKAVAFGGATLFDSIALPLVMGAKQPGIGAQNKSTALHPNMAALYGLEPQKFLPDYQAKRAEYRKQMLSKQAVRAQDFPDVFGFLVARFNK